MKEKIQEAIQAIKVLLDDGDVPRGIKNTLNQIIQTLTRDELGVDRALDKLTQIMDSGDMPQFVRTELWNISSLLEAA